MQILLQLGANQTAFVQFVLFVIAISFLTVVVYGPFFKAYDQRLQQTKGAEQVALETEEEAKKIELIYQSRAREINNKIKDIFETYKKEATEGATQILNKARASVGELTDKTRTDIETQKVRAQSEIQTISNEVAAEMTKKLTGAI
jgi:F0F1-type ATP synthase membrane subunit b/b'